ncbi:AAA family ATPase [Undibacterium luofuense]|uniref:AAA family ATPase n=1 Tax=Undibacterium luofuense TaxID=2828733 RepID=A0A941DNA1_9BURK|nr:AAA family ATPase [Undibacterium luofuense]MBR7784033.1 AAA family ATPase [Undibacterium luofuense]
MRLEKLCLKNFRGYADSDFTLHPQFNLIVGENGAGKTSFLEAAAVAVGSWLLGFRGHDSRNILERDVRNVIEFVERRYRELPQYPVRITARGIIQFELAGRLDIEDGRTYESGGLSEKSSSSEKIVQWERSVEAAGGKTTRRGANDLKKIAESMAVGVLNQKPYVLPVIRYFGAGRLWESVRDTTGKALSKHKGKLPAELADDADELEKLLHESKKLSEPFYGYRMSVDKRCNPDDLIRWMGVERRNEIDEEVNSLALRLVYRAIETMLPEIEYARYSIKLRTLVLKYESGEWHTFSELSDGYRNVVAIASDLAIKAAMLNPQLAEQALQMTPGVVLIDELDLHLHPKWQRRIIEDLRRTFPLMQFICTTHSPFLIQSLRTGEELIVLDGQPPANLGQMPIQDIARGVMGAGNTDVSQRYEAMKQAAKDYLEILEEAARSPREAQEEFRHKLAEAIAPYANNPAYQAFLEMQRVSKLGE